MALTPYQLHNFVNDSEPDLDATAMNEIDQGIKDAIDGVNGILNALSNQIENDPAKFASSAALYAVNDTLNTVSTDLTALQGTVSTLNSNLVFATTTPTHNTSVVDTNNSKQRISQFLKILNVDINVKALTQYTEYEALYTGIMPSSRLSLRVAADTGKIIPAYLETNGTLKLNTVDSTTAFSIRFQIVV